MMNLFKSCNIYFQRPNMEEWVEKVNEYDKLSNENFYDWMFTFLNYNYILIDSKDPDKMTYKVLNAIDDRSLAKLDFRKLASYIQEIKDSYYNITENYEGVLQTANKDAYGVSSDNLSFILLQAIKEFNPQITFCMIEYKGQPPIKAGWFTKHYTFIFLPMAASKIKMFNAKMNKWRSMMSDSILLLSSSFTKFCDISEVKWFDITYKTLKNDIKLIKSGKVK